MTQQEKYLEKIQALLRKAESTTPEEAELLYGKAQELMVKYAIDEAMLAAAGQKADDDEIVREEFVAVGIWLYPMSQLATNVLRANNCKVVKIPHQQREVNGRLYKKAEVRHAVGYKSDIDRTRMLLTSLEIQALRAENAWWREHKDAYAYYTHAQQHRERRQFLFSFAMGVYKKLTEATARGRAAAEAEHSKGSVELVLRDRSRNVDDKFGEMFPNLGSSRSRYAGGGNRAAGAGFEAGQRADVGQPGLKNTRQIAR